MVPWKRLNVNLNHAIFWKDFLEIFFTFRINAPCIIHSLESIDVSGKKIRCILSHVQIMLDL